jgi:deoxyadenosine/deoxycytidine kinase
MERGYIDELNQGYDQAFEHHAHSPVLTIEAEKLDYVANPDDLEFVIRRVREALGIDTYQASLPMRGEA